MIKITDLALRWMFMGSGLTLALWDFHEIFVMYYSGGDPEVTSFQKAKLYAECILLLVATTVIAVSARRG